MSERETSTTIDSTDERAPATRFAFVDGIRGFLALWIVLCHMVQAYLQVDLRPVPPDVTRWLEILFMTKDRTAAFFVVSGFCLMLPVIRDGSGLLRGGVRGFLSRRGVRLLPPYYISLLIVVAINLPLAAWGVDLRGFNVNGGLALDWGGFISHLFLIHNLNELWMYGTFPPVWFVAAEWQAYLFFALILVPVWRVVLLRKGAIAALFPILGIGAVAGYFWYLLPKPWNLEWALPHFAFLFTVGMAACAIALSPDPKLQRFRDAVPWTLVVVMGIVTLTTLRWFLKILNPVGDLLVGLIVFAGLLQCTREYAAGEDTRPGLLRRWVEATPLTRIGAYSYSLFLVHYVIVSHWSTFMRWLKWEDTPLVFAFWVGNAVLIALTTALFYWYCERPFETWRARVRAQAPSLGTIPTGEGVQTT